MYLSNKANSTCDIETNTEFDFGQVAQMTKMNNFNVDIFCRLTKKQDNLYDLNQLISDSSVLGRYKNFVGASSKIANYIKQLDPKIRKNFILEEKYHDYMKQPQHIKNEKDKIKALIEQHNQLYTLNLKGQEGLEYYNKQKAKSPRKLSYKYTPRESQVIELSAICESDSDLNRIHGSKRGRLLKPLKRQDHKPLVFSDSPRSVPLHPIKRSQIYQLFMT